MWHDKYYNSKEYYYDYFFGDRFFKSWNMIFIMVTLLLIVITIVFISNRKSSKSKKISSLEYLKIRYAQGEITEDEYFNKKRIIEES